MVDLRRAPEEIRVRPLRRAVPWWAAHAVLLPAGLVLWVISLPGVNLDAMTGFGLVSVLPVTYFVALAVLCVGFAIAVVQRRSGHRLLLGYTVATLAVLHATSPLLYSTPRYPYVYKHIAVMRFIDRAGTVDRTVDIYHNWPGFFAAGAFVARATGVDPMAFANWADPLFAACGALGVYFVARSLTADRRRVAAAVWLYVLASCTSQTYLAPQSLAFFLALIVLGVAIRWLAPSRSDRSTLVLEAVDRPLTALSRRLLQRWPVLRRIRLLPELRAEFPGTVPPAAGRERSPFAAAVLLLLSAAVVVSHQLSPVFMVVGLLALFVLGRSRSWSSPVLVAVMMAAWVGVSYAYVSLHFSLFAFDLFSNVQGVRSDVPSAGSAAHQTVGTVARLATAGMLGLAAAAWWSAPRHRRETFIWGLVSAPALVLLVQSYGGEAIYRVTMFALPWLCYLASRIVVAPIARRLLGAAVVSVAGTLGAVLFVVNYYGSDQFNRVRAEEVLASAWFETHTPPGSVLAYLNGNWPTPLTAEYPKHLNVDGNWGAGVFSDERFTGYTGRALTPADVAPILTTMREMGGGGTVYIGIGPAQISDAEQVGLTPPGSLGPFLAALNADPDTRLVFRDGDAYVLELLPEPAGAAAPVAPPLPSPAPAIR